MRQTHEKILDGIKRARGVELSDLCDVERQSYVESEFGQSTSEGTGYVLRNQECQVTSVPTSEASALGLLTGSQNLWVSMNRVDGITSTDKLNITRCRLPGRVGRYEILVVSETELGLRLLVARKG